MHLISSWGITDLLFVVAADVLVDVAGAFGLLLTVVAPLTMQSLHNLLAAGFFASSLVKPVRYLYEVQLLHFLYPVLITCCWINMVRRILVSKLGAITVHVIVKPAHD